MALNRNQFARYRIIDECFQNRYHIPSTSKNPAHIGYWPVCDLQEKTCKRLDLDVPVSERQIKEDLRRMKDDPDLSFFAPIENKRGVGYRYSDPSYSMVYLPLTPTEIDILEEIITLLSQFQGFRYFEGVEGIIHQIEQRINRSEFHQVQFDVLPDYTGTENIEPVKKAIRNQSVLLIDYHPFNGNPHKLHIHPYLLKEYNNRWFVYAYTLEFSGEGIFGLERIRSIKQTNLIYRKPATEKITAYFRDIIGVTNYQDQKTEDIILQINKERAQYMLTKPVHYSQEIISKNEGSVTIRLHVKPNPELEALILSYGEDLTVLAPESLKTRILEHLRGAVGNYTH